MSPGWVKVCFLLFVILINVNQTLMSVTQTEMGQHPQLLFLPIFNTKVYILLNSGGPMAISEIDFSVSGMLDTIDKVDVASGELLKGFHGGTYPF